MPRSLDKADWDQVSVEMQANEDPERSSDDRLEEKNKRAVYTIDRMSKLTQLLHSLKMIVGVEKLAFFEQKQLGIVRLWTSEPELLESSELVYNDTSTLEKSGWTVVNLPLPEGARLFQLALFGLKNPLPPDFASGVGLALNAVLLPESEGSHSKGEQGSATFDLIHQINYWNLFNHLVQGIVYHDQTGQIIEANPAAEKILGLTKDQILGKTSIDPSWQSIHEDGSPFPGQDHPAMIALHTGKEVRNVIMGIRSDQKKETTWIMIDAIPEFLDAHGKPRQVMASFADITQIKTIKSKIRESRAILDAIMESTSESIWAVDLEEKLLYANSAFLDRFKRIHLNEAQVGEPILRIFTGEFLETWRSYYRRVFQGETISILEQFSIDGGQVHLSTVITPISMGTKVIGAAAFSQDITDTTLKIQTIENQNNRLREIAWIQSHVVRAPLARLMGLMNVIDSQEEDDLMELKKLLAMLRKSAEELDSVIRDIVGRSEGLLEKSKTGPNEN